MELLARVSANEELDKAVAGILVNMTMHPLCCEELMCLGGVESIFSIIKKSQRDGTKQILLKVARNLGRWIEMSPV
ncbi:hypothetical protein ACHAW5_010052 [Stephanodiscus triporus]|uniref:Armadillo repeat-containing protein 8 n=1 Tax=Stephanodiscus triporus TaxID=2934178 RepID=A0ABD3QNQ8_9STRA